MLSFYQIIGVILLLLLIYKYATRNYNYWTSRAIPTAKGLVPGFGHILDIFPTKRNMATIIEDIYFAHSESMVGFYQLQQPTLLVRHPDLVKTVLQTEFSSFSDHVAIADETDPMALDPFFVNGQKWKDMRTIYSSAYSTKRLKFIAFLVKESCDKLLNFINTQLNGKQSIEFEAKKLFSKFTAEQAASSILGVEGNAFSQKTSYDSFLSMMEDILVPSTSNAMTQNIVLLFPTLNRFLKKSFTPHSVTKRFKNILDNIRMIRKRDKITNEVILQHLEDYQAKHDPNHDTILSHAFSFFIENFETSSLTLSFTSYLLAKHPEIQKKVRNEIMEVMEKYNEISYDSLNKLSYLEQVIKETLRIYPPAGAFHKICSKSTTLRGPDGLSCSLKAGDSIYISLFGIHKDPEFWENPNEFIPERHDKNAEESQRSFVNFPFGEGPRMCPGMRMALLQVKAAIAVLLMNFSIECSPKMKEPIKINPKYFLTSLEGGIWIELRCL